ncbi:MAG: anaerobic ribonucleoside-triphosphate reductase [Rickettsiales bacterium]|nr:anaerobic ribonucleoside-triphosphate reductase [Rickettsiales bacterium]
MFSGQDNSKRTRCEIWTRAMGYCRPVANFNRGKKSEFAERKFFTESKANCMSCSATDCGECRLAA